MIDKPFPLGQPLRFRRLLDEASRETRRHFRELFLPVAVPVAISQLLVVVAQILFTDQVWAGQTDPAALMGEGSVFVGLLIFSWVALGLCYSTLGAMATDALAGRPVSFKKSLLFLLAPSRLGTLIGVGVAIFLGMMCCLVPGFILLVLWGLVIPVMVQEERGWADALTRSTMLSGYKPEGQTSPRWKIFTLVIVGYLLAMAVAFVAQGPFLIVQQFFMFRDIAGGQDVAAAQSLGLYQWLAIPGVLASSLAQTAVTVYVSLGTAMLYFDIRRRSDGVDLEMAVDDILDERGISQQGSVLPEPGV